MNRAESENNHQSLSKSLNCIFKGYRERYAILENEFGYEIIWPIERFPHHITIGEKLEIQILTPQDRENELIRAKRQLLEELIN